jgi:hypothetical protein
MEAREQNKALTAEERGKLPDSDFAVPGKRKLPIHDREHAELAWRLLDRTEGLTPEERAEAKRRILRRLKEFGVDVSAYEGAEEILQAAVRPAGEEVAIGERVRMGLEADLAGASSGSGQGYEVTLIRAGRALNGWRFPGPVLEKGTPLFEGANSFVDHVDGFRHPSVRNLVGVVHGVTWDGPDEALRGRLRLSRTPAAEWVGSMVDQIVSDRDAGLPVPRVGLSADLYCGYYVEDDVRVATEIHKVYSVDVVFYPASGGSFDRVLNCVKGGREMENLDGEVVATEGAGAGGEQEVATERVSLAKGGEQAKPPGQGARTSQETADALLGSLCATMLEGTLTQCDLPVAMKEVVRAQFAGRVFQPEELQLAVDVQRKLLAQLLEDRVIRGMGEQRPDAPRVEGMWSSLDRIQLAFDKLLGLPLPEGQSDVPRLTGIRELYLALTGDYDFYGRFYPERVQLANVTTSSMTSVVKNALNKVLLQAYNVRPRWWEPIVYEEDFNTLNQITWIKTGGIGSLPTVSEGGAYTELDWSDNEETADFVKKGGYIGITLEMMDRDDVASVKRIPRELGNAAWRTLSALVSAIFTDNSGAGPVMGCGHNVFDASNHGNLRTTALSTAEWDAVIQAVYNQTEPTSGAKLALRPKFILVPIELEKTALEVVGQPWATADNKHYLDPRYQSATVVVVPQWADTNDWAGVCDPNDCPGICTGYRYGREPELFVADDQVVGSMFSNDEMRIKCRFFVAVGVADYRPLHKSNVA